MTGYKFSQVTDDDQSGIIWVVSLLFLIYTLLTFITRGCIKWNLWGWDDWAVTVAQVFATGQYVALFLSLHNGLGKTSEMLTSAARAQLSQYAFASQILIIASLCLSKCSVILLIRRVFTRDLALFWMICNIFLGFCGAWAIASMILISVGCKTSSYIPPAGNDTCSGFDIRWRIVVALDVVTECVMIILPVYFLWTLQMARNLKMRVVAAFAFRLPVAIFSLIFLFLFTRIPTQPKPGVAISTALAWSQGQLAYSLISATIPCLKSFIKSFDTSFGMGEGGSSAPYYGHSSHNTGTGGGATGGGTMTGSKNRDRSEHHGKGDYKIGGEEIQLQDMASPRKSSSKDRDAVPVRRTPESFSAPLRPEKVKNSTTIEAGVVEGRPESRGSLGSWSGSQEMIIRRDVVFQVQHSYLKLD